MKKLVIALSMLFLIANVYSQSIMYVNVDTLGIKKYPDKNSETLLYIHAPTKVQVEELTENRFKDLSEIKENWVGLKFFVSDGSWMGGQTIYGYLPKKFLVEKLSSLSVPADTTITFAATFPGTLKRAKIIFHRSSRGFCYYYNSFRIKEFTDKKYCENLIEK